MKPATLSATTIIITSILLLCASGLFAAGMSVHGETATRAAYFFDSEEFQQYRQYLANNPGAYQAGSCFPDWGYAFGYPNESEEAHWPPFLHQFASHIHENYPKPWDEETIRSAVFFLGVISHDIADIDWHGLGVNEGLIDVMSGQEFHDNWSDAHSQADTGAEFVHRYSNEMDWLTLSWYWPFDDLAEIYRQMGYRFVNPEVLEQKTFMLFLGAIGNKIGGSLLFNTFASKSPFLVEHLQDYFVGGIDAMAVRTMWWWQDYITEMETGNPSDADWPCVNNPDQKSEFTRQEMELGWWMWQNGLFQIHKERTERGVIFHAELPVDFLFSTKEAADDSATNATRITSSKPYSYLGQSMASGDFNADGIADIAIGAPGYGFAGSPQSGQVYIFYGTTQEMTNDLDVSQADITLSGDIVHGRFGWQLATVDFNRDGHDDLAVSAPATHAEDYSFHGALYVFYGNGGLPSDPDVTISGFRTHETLGHSLESGDVNGDGFNDLLAGSPYAKCGGAQRGAALVFLSDDKWSQKKSFTTADADLSYCGENNYDWFGFSLGIIDRGNSENIFLVGAPGSDSCNKQATGSLYGFDLSLSDSTPPAFVLSGEDEFDKFGHSFTAGGFVGTGKNLLAVSAPSRTHMERDNVGTVYVIDPGNLSGKLTVSESGPLAVLNGESAHARLGWRLASGDINGDDQSDLLVTSPWQQADDYAMTGKAWLWTGGSDFLAKVQFPQLVSWSSVGFSNQEIFGIAALLFDFNGDGVDDIILSSSRNSQATQQAGRVTIYSDMSPVPLTVSPYTVKQGAGNVSFRVTGSGFTEGIVITFQKGSTHLYPSSITVRDSQNAFVNMTISSDAQPGIYSMTISNELGMHSLADAINVIEEDTPIGDDDDVLNDDDDDDSNNGCGING